jgi:hypothetical protein
VRRRRMRRVYSKQKRWKRWTQREREIERERRRRRKRKVIQSKSDE